VVFRSLLSTGEIIGISLAIIGAINAVIALVYYARISKVIWMDELKNPEQEKTFEFQNPLKVVGAFTVLITFISGVFPGIFSYLGDVSSIFFGN
jgi:NADH:ubiquinone oxidoreductase subunit 2 (subunit N)